MDENLVFPPTAQAILDITKAPYHADPTGQRDCTEALRKAVDDVMGEIIRLRDETVLKLERDPNPDARMGFENKKVDGKPRVILLHQLPKQKFIYFPNGTYLVSDTVTYSFRDLRNSAGMELNMCLHFLGQSRDGVRIKLKDFADGFDIFDFYKPVICFMKGGDSNVSMSNSFENITIDVGTGNPGAVGLDFFANNTGTVRNVKIVSSDPWKLGGIGMTFLHHNFSGVLVKDVEIEGFDFGIKVEPRRMYIVFENIHLRAQRRMGFVVSNTITSIHGLYSDNTVPGLALTGPNAHVTLVDGDLRGGQPVCRWAGLKNYAIYAPVGQLFARNISTAGYEGPVTPRKDASEFNLIEGTFIREYCSDKVHSLFPGQSPRSLNLPIEEAPVAPRPRDFDQWASVHQFGAKGNGVSDDSDAIQKAMDSGKALIYFEPGTYVIDSPVRVPASVKFIDFMYCDIAAGDNLKKQKDAGTFTISEDGEDPLRMENLLAWEEYYGLMYLIDHACRRTLVLRNLHTQTGPMYRNSISGGKVFIENVCCTTGSLETVVSTTGCLEYRNTPNFIFKGQKVWARQINPERSLREVVNDGSILWVLGFKSEGQGIAFETINGGFTEVLGGVLNIGPHRDRDAKPAFLNADSNVSVVASSNGWTLANYFSLVVLEKRGDVSKRLMDHELPERFSPQITLPLYVGYTKRVEG